MHSKMKLERHERMYGPHFTEECALKAVSKMHNSDGTKGAHWDLAQATKVAEQYGVNLKTDKYNKYDWYVALNMIRSDYYKFVFTTFNSDNIRYFVELTKAFLNDEDADEGKMWYYFKYVMCDAYHEDDDEEDYEDEEYEYPAARRATSNMKHVSRKRKGYIDEDDEDDDDMYNVRASIYRKPYRYMSRY